MSQRNIPDIFWKKENAHGLIMLNACNTLSLSWEQTKQLVIDTYYAFEKKEGTHG